jgi:hypothetical protein
MPANHLDIGKIKNGVHVLSFTPDSKALEAIDSDYCRTVFSVPEGKVLATSEEEGPYLTQKRDKADPCTSPDGTMKASLAKGLAVRVVGAKEVCICEFPRPYLKAVEQLLFSPDGKTVVAMATAGEGEEEFHIVRILSLNEKREFAALAPAPATTIAAMAFSSDGRWFAVGNNHGSVLVFDWPKTLIAQAKAADEYLQGADYREKKRKALEAKEENGLRLTDLYWLGDGDFPGIFRFEFSTYKVHRDRHERERRLPLRQV